MSAQSVIRACPESQFTRMIAISKEGIVWKINFFNAMAPLISSEWKILFDKMPSEPTRKPCEKPKPYQQKPKVPVAKDAPKTSGKKRAVKT
jgi:hypothetical protein